MPKERVGLVRDIPPGNRKVVNIRGREIVVFNVQGDFYALLNRCPHEGANLSRGIVTGLPESSEPGCYKLSRPGEIRAAPGTDGNSTCGLENPTAIHNEFYQAIQDERREQLRAS